MALTNKLSAIGEAIREKTGKSELLTLDAMPEEIRGIEGGGGGLPEEAYTVSGDCSYRFSVDGWNWFINNYGKQVKTSGITNAANMFYKSIELEEIPFELNMTGNFALNNTFSDCKKLRGIPKINSNGGKVSTTKNMFLNCYNLRYLPDDMNEGFDWSLINNSTSSYSYTREAMFQNCYSLRKAPIEFLKNDNPRAVSSTNIYAYLFFNCYALDEVIGLPITDYKVNWTSNSFVSTAHQTYRLKNFTFEMNADGSPKKVNWKSQTITLSISGYQQYDLGNITNNNSGITTDKEVKDDATYQALKNDPDWYAGKKEYSRYNHDSAVATINSLPDASEYLATAGGTNTIVFTGEAGSLTDGGAINTLTEEEIAVATAKGWTVSLV